MFNSKRKLFSSERGAATSWLAGITSAALILAAVALPATATEGDGTTVDPAPIVETTPPAAPAVEDAPAEEPAVESTPAEDLAPAEAPAVESTPADEAIIGEALEDDAPAADAPDAPAADAPDAPAADDPAPASDEPAPAPEPAVPADAGAASSTDGTAPDNNSPPVEVFVPGINVETDGESTTIEWPAFGIDDNYTLQVEDKDGSWRTLDTHVDETKGTSTRDYAATVEGLEAGETYTARIVTAETQELALSATSDAVDSSVSGPARGSMVRAPGGSNGNGNPKVQVSGEFSIIVPLAADPRADGVPLPNSVTPEQWQPVQAPGKWITGEINEGKSDYAEGDTVPFRLSLGKLKDTDNYVVPICRDYYETGTSTYGYTMFMPYNTSRNPDLGGLTPVTNPDFPNIAGIGVAVLDVDASFTGPSGTYEGTAYDCKDVDQRLVVGKIAVTDPTSAQFLLWGGRLAAPGDKNPDVSYGDSPSYWNGGSLQMRLASPDKTLGIMPGAIIPKVAVYKYHDVNGNRDQDGVAAEPGLPDWTIFVDAGSNPNSQLDEGEQSTVTGPLGYGLLALNWGTTYRICEVLKTGWANTDPGTICQTYVMPRLDPKNPVPPTQIVFGNFLAGQILVDKVTDPAGSSQVFTFDPSWSDTNFTLTDAADPQSSGPLAPGNYSVAELATAGWDLTNTVCSDGSPITEITLAAGETVTCTFTNTRLTGDLTVSKTVVGDVAGAAMEFTVDVDCEPGDTYDHAGVVLNEDNGWTVTYTGIPTGVTCSVSEPTVPEGWTLTGISPAEVTIVEGETPVEITVTNTRLTGDLTVSKTVVGDVAGAAMEFTVDVDCEPGDTYDHAGVVLNEDNGWTVTYTGIPTGVTCSVSEPTVPEGWTLTGISPAEVTIVEGETPVEITVTNTRLTGDLTIVKTMVGDDTAATTDFLVDLDCDVDAYDRSDIPLNEANMWSAFIQDIPTGVTCSVSEPTVPEGWTLTGISPAEVTIVEGETPVEITVTNTRLTGDLTVSKTVVGDVAGAAMEFTVDVDCEPGDTYDHAGVVLNEDNGWTVTYTGIPTGVTCSVSEPTVPEGWTLTGISPAEVTIVEGETPVEITVTNTRLTGDLTIVKTMVGDDTAATTDFLVDLDCDVDAYDRSDIPLNEANMWSAFIQDIPTGVTCSVSEPTVPEGWTLTGISPAEVTIVEGETPVEITVTNTRLTGDLTVSKTVVGDVAGAAMEFTVDVDCEPGDTYDHAGVVLNEDNGWTVTYTGIPTGVTCSVSEPTVPEGWTLTGISPAEVTIVEGETPVEITVTNTRLTGDLTIVKTMVGDDTAATTDFLVDLDCDVDAYDRSDIPLNEANMWSAFIQDIPTGVTCSVSEPTVPEGWTLTGISPAEVTIVEGETPVEITVTNTRLTGDLTVSKTVVGDVAGAAMEFTVDVDCEPGDTYDHAGVVLNEDNGWTVTYTGIPTGVTCSVSEPTVPEGWTLTGISPAEVTIVEGETPVEITVTNTRLTGDLTIVKTMVGDDTAATTDFLVDLDCDVDAYDRSDIPLNEANMWSAFIQDIPTGVTCSVSEPTVPEGWTLTGISPAEVTIVEGETPVEITVTNTRLTGDLTVSKTVVGDVAGAAMEFTVDVDCEPGDTYDHAGVVLNEDNGWTVTYTGIPTGVTCSVSEPTVPEGWTLTGISPAEVTIVEGETPVEITVTNTRLTGDLVVKKVVVGPIAGASTDFTVNVDCTPGDTYDKTGVVLNQANNWTVTYTGIPTGVSCVVTESVVPAGWALTSISPSPAVIGGTPVTVTVTNTRTLGDLVVKKVVVGPIAGASTDFTVNVDCTPGDTYDKTGVVLNQANNWTVTYTGIPTGVSCVVTESVVPAGWALTSISPSPAVIGGTPVTVTVTNTRTLGDLVVKKVVVGPIAGASTDFTVNVDCTPGDTYDKTGVVLNQANNWTVTYTGIPTGVSCVVTESVVPAGWALTSISPSPAVIGGTPVTVTVTNTRNGIPTLDKTSAIADGGPSVEPGDFINYSVTVSNTGGLPITGPVVDTLPAGLTVVPTTISSGGTANAALTVITWQVTLPPGASLTFTYQALVGEGVQTGQNLVNIATFQGLQDSTTTPVELPPVAGIEEEIVAAEEEEIAATGANNVGNMVGAALLAMLAGGLMVTFGRRRRNQG